MTTTFKATPLSNAAVEALGQIFVSGPTWDGNLASKSGCGELVLKGLARKVNGWSFLTEDGVRAASEWDLSALRAWHDRRWYDKASCR